MPTSPTSFGAAVMKKHGWQDGGGLGKLGDGMKDSIHVSKKDDVKGIGYSAKVDQSTVWSQQSIAYNDVLSRLSGCVSSPTTTSPTSSQAPSAGKFAAAYQKRRALKTEVLNADEDKRHALLGSKMHRTESSAGVEEASSEDASTLRSPILRRVTVRCVALEPKATSDAAVIVVRKPTPKPPKATDTPFLA